MKTAVYRSQLKKQYQSQSLVTTIESEIKIVDLNSIQDERLSALDDCDSCYSSESDMEDGASSSLGGLYHSQLNDNQTDGSINNSGNALQTKVGNGMMAMVNR